MNKLYLYILSILAASLSTACTDELPIEKSPQQYLLEGDYYFVLKTDDAPSSRMLYTSYTHSEFTTGDRIGVFAPQNEDKSQIPNDVFSARDMSTQPPSGPHQVLVPSSGEIKKEVPKHEPEYLLYYPYKATATLKSITDGMSHAVKEDQKDEKSHNESDLLWCHKLLSDTEKEADSISIYMHHAMATIVVKIAKDSINAENGITLPDMPTSATGIKLRLEDKEMTLDKMNYTVNLNNNRKNISMYRLSEDTDEDCYVYRAFIPACWTMTEGTDIFTLSLRNKDGLYEETTYKLAQDVAFKPGHYYTFTLRSGQKPVVPDVTDEDSWVLEVKDPDDDKLVGYLCREYVYWAPSEFATNYRGCTPGGDGSYTFTKGNTNLKGGTNNQDGAICMISTTPASEELLEQLNDGGKYSMSIENMIPAINSQAWVFYNLLPDGHTPDLTKGTVLRFIYDIKGGGGEPGYTPYLHPKYSHLSTVNGTDYFTKSYWPSPNRMTSTNGQGIFKVRHGHEYTNTDDLKTGGDGGHYGFESKEHLEYYMHGGVITWDPVNNIIDKFFMPAEKITNDIAYTNGHIAIKKENGTKQVFVSYSPCISKTEDVDGNAVGDPIPKKFTVGEVSYPLRKVGFNQFWSGKSLRSTKNKDNKEIECFNVNVPGKVGAVNFLPFYTNDEPADYIRHGMTDVLPSGYIYPSAEKDTEDYDGCKNESDFDPYADPSLRDSVALLYNMTAFIKGDLKPADTSFEEYRFPTMGDMIKLRRYGGVLFAAKWITDHVRTLRADGTYEQSSYEAHKRGMILKTDAYCANISGLDLRAYGMRWIDKDRVFDLGVRNYFFIDATKDFPFEKNFNGLGDAAENNPMAWIEIFQFSPWDCWGSQALTHYRYHGHTINNLGAEFERAHSRVFAPIRVLMSFKNPIGNGASAAEVEYMSRTMVRKIDRSTDRNVKLNVVKSTARK